jgi:hypothetical protein
MNRKRADCTLSRKAIWPVLGCALVALLLSGPVAKAMDGADVLAWAKIQDSTNPHAFGDFIRQYPNSPLADDARSHMAALNRTNPNELQAQQRQRAATEQAVREAAAKARLKAEQAERSVRHWVIEEIRSSMP